MSEIKFVVVDDAIFMRTLLKKMIEEINENYKVVGEGSNGYEAIKQAKEHKPDVLTMDITMPDMDGLQAIEEVLKVSPDTKIVMCSAMGQQALVLESIKKGACEFVVKPFEKLVVEKAIKNALLR